MNLIQPQRQTEGPSALSAEALIMEGRLQGKETHMHSVPVRENEKPWHLHLARYLAMGMEQGDAARACNCDPSTVSLLLQAPWFQERVAQFMKESSSDIMTLLKGAQLSAFATLVEVTNSNKTPAAARIQGVKEIFERTMGKSVQYVEAKVTGASDNPVAESKVLEAELARMRKAETPSPLQAAKQLIYSPQTNGNGSH